MLVLLAALAVGVFVTAFFALFFRRPQTAIVVEQRLEDAKRAPDTEEGLEGGDLLLGGGRSRLPMLRRVLATTKWSHRASTDLLQAGVPLKVSEYFIIRVLTGIGGVLVGFVLTGASGMMGLIFTVALAFVGWMAPSFWVQMKKGRRQSMISMQLVETLQLISNALRSGFAFTQAVEMAAKQVAPPIQEELELFLRDYNLGSKLDDALRAMVDRTGSLDIEMVVTTLMVQRTTGGNLSEVLDNVAETIRERQRLQGEIKALTAQQRLTGIILSIYPAFLGLIFFALAPSLMKVLWEDEVGRVLLGVAITLQVMGAMMIRQITKLEV